MKKRLTLFLSILMLLCLSACGGGERKTPTDVQVSKKSSSIAPSSPATTTENEPSESAATELTPIHVGENGATDKLKVSFLDCFQMTQVPDGTYSYYEADEGFTYVISVLEIENISSEDMTIWPASDFEYYADNALAGACLLGYAPPSINGYQAIESETKVKPGRKVTGYVVAEVPVDTSHFEIEYEGMLFEN